MGDWSDVDPSGSRWQERPSYAAQFRCIGARCEDGCCGGWDIPVDRATFQRYQGFRSERLVQIVARAVTIERPHGPDALYALIRRDATGRCPFQRADQMCGIQMEYGATLLSATCSIYPRSLSWVGGTLEGSLSLSCPEAARKVLLDPEWMRQEGNLFAGDFRIDNSYRLACDATGFARHPAEAYVALRSLILDVVGLRSQSMGNRLLMIGELCRRLDQVVQDGRKRQLLRIARQYVREGTPPVSRVKTRELRLRLAVFEEFARARLREGVGQRFGDVLDAFFVCAGDRSDMNRFAEAEANIVHPFFERFPHVLENFLANYIFQNLFPYGREGSADFASLSLFEEWVLMTTQFAWISGLLTGVASRFGPAFGEEQVVMTVQSYAREVEHYPAVLRSLHAAVRAHELHSLDGMACLLGSRAIGGHGQLNPRATGWNLEAEIQKLLFGLGEVEIPSGMVQRLVNAMHERRIA